MDETDRPALFKERHFEAESIVLCVRWYLRFGLSFRNLEEMMAERNLHVDHVTIWRWLQRYAPELNRRCRQELGPTNSSWRVDETYLRVAGKWTIYVGQWIRPMLRLIFCYRPDAMLQPQSDSCRRLCDRRSPSSPSDECGREPVVAQGNRRVEKDWGTGPPVALPTRPERTGEVVGKGRHRGAGRVRWSITRTRRCCLSPSDEPTHRSRVCTFATLPYNSWPVPFDVDGDGRGEIIVSNALRNPYTAWFEPRYPTSQFLVFGSDSWKKIPTVWNQTYFVPNQVDEKLAFKIDYQPRKTHNTWMRQPLQ